MALGTEGSLPSGVAAFECHIIKCKLSSLPHSFTSALYSWIALLVLSPEGDGLILPFGLIGLTGLVYSVSIAVKTARRHRLFSESWLFHGGVPIVCYMGVIAAAWLGLTSTRQAYSVFRAISALLLLIGMRNAWAVAIGIARRNSK